MPIFKWYAPYDETDHVLNIALNLLTGGTCLDHLENRRNDEAYLDALAGADGSVYIIPVDDNAEFRRFDLHTDWVTDVAYSPDGKLLISGGRDKATKVSSAETGQLLRGVDISGDIINAVASDESFAVSAGRDRKLNAYEYKIALRGAEIRGMGGNGLQPVNKKSQYLKAFEGQPGEVLDMAASGDRKLIATGGRRSPHLPGGRP